MFQSLNNTLPLIITNEKEALLSSIINMLRQKGFVVLQQEQSIFVEEHATVEEMDGLSILRYVSQNWSKEVPVVIAQGAQLAEAVKIAA